MEQDPMFEWAVMQWIDDVTHEPHSRVKEYPDCIKDGKSLCRLMSTLTPGSVPSDDDSGNAQTRVELFRQAAREYGVPDTDLFEPKDLVDKQNIPAVTHCLKVLADVAQKRGFEGPSLKPVSPGPKQQESHSSQTRMIFH